MDYVEIEKLKRTPEYKNAMELDSWLNNMGFNYKNFAKSIRFMHPTIQQSVFRLVKALIEEQADLNNERNFDGRNKASRDLCRTLMKCMQENENSLPFV